MTREQATRGARIVGEASSVKTDISVIVVGTDKGYHWQLYMGDHLLRADENIWSSFAEAEDHAKAGWFLAFKDAIAGPELFG